MDVSSTPNIISFPFLLRFLTQLQESDRVISTVVPSQPSKIEICKLRPENLWVSLQLCRWKLFVVLTGRKWVRDIQKLICNGQFNLVLHITTIFEGITFHNCYNLLIPTVRIGYVKYFCQFSWYFFRSAEVKAYLIYIRIYVQRYSTYNNTRRYNKKFHQSQWIRYVLHDIFTPEYKR